MKQIEISDNTPRKGGVLFQTFYIDKAADFPYWRPLYLVVCEDEKTAAKSGKSQYFLDHSHTISASDWKQRVKDIKVMAKKANPEKDKIIFAEVQSFNNASKISSRTVCEISHRIAEEKINELIISY